ncbi:hypothetical protein [Bdellovibrio sp. ArHS]|uniref:hypothetical protein n=1 Tax=Bdellovibrio sp. ArHS TaxID=1569284 RepID=UPI000A3FA468|nr:hypothetical protein [Bdellovibrio sp. ArHS]
MFSKKIFSYITVAMLAAGALAGCDSKVGEAPPPPESHELGGTKCLTEVKPVVKHFIEGTASKAEVSSGWDCAETAIQTFKRYVRGNVSDRYTSQELATFLENNFLDAAKKETIPVGLQVEVMKLKQIFVGGSAEYITRGEIDKIIRLFGSFREMTMNLTPYMRVLSLNWTVSEANNIQTDVRFFEEANKEIQNAARTLASLIESNGRSYKLADFVVLMEQMSVFFNEKWDFPKTIAKYMPVVLKVKKALAGGDENYVAPSEWRRFALLGARGYIQYLRYYYFIKGVPETGTGYRLSYLSRTVEDVLSVFQDLVAEKPEGVVSRDEVNDLLKTLQVVWPEFKVSNNLVFEAMKLKQLFFGGSVDSFSTTDFETARLKVSRIKILIERFLPYYSIYGREWEPELYENEEAQKLFMESQFVLEATVREAGVLFEGAYDLNNLVSLVREVEALYPPAGESYADLIEEHMPLIVDVKNLILGGNDSSLKKANWSVLLGFAARFYSDFLYYNYFLKDQPIEKPLTVGYLSVFANQSINIARDLLAIKKEAQFSRAEINKILGHLSSLGILPADLKPQSLDQVVGLILNNLLTEPERRVTGYVPDALNLSSLEVLRGELQVWLDTELFIAQTTENWKPEEGLLAKDLQELLKTTSLSAAPRSPLASGLYEFLLTVQSPVPLTVDSESRVVISNKFEQAYSAKTLRQLNLYRALSRLAVRSFTGSLDRLNTYKGVNLEEVQNAFMTVRPALVELGILEPKNTSFASSRFREANIFVPHSDGNSLSSYAELTDLIGMIWSGLNINSMLRQELIKKCFNGNTDVKNDALVSLSCVRASYKEALPMAATSLPEYLKFQKSASKDEWAIYMNNIIKAAGYIPNEKNMALLEDISLAPHVMQYIEMIYARFDRNKDGVINTPESLNAFPAFKGILLELAKDQIANGSIKEADLLDLFTYILRYGKPPETLKEKLRFVLSWKGKRDKWDVWADRIQLSEILGYIADQVTKAAKANKATEGFAPNPILSVSQPVPQSPPRSE